MAQQHLARIDLSGIPNQFEGSARFAYVGKEGKEFFPTDFEEAHRFYNAIAAAKAAARVTSKIRSVVMQRH